MWRDHRQYCGNEQRRHEVDEHRVGGYALNVATKFSGDHGTRSGGGTNEAEHGAFDDGAAISDRKIVEDGRQCGESQRLEGEMPRVPAA